MSIAERNKSICRPKLMVKPKPKKSIIEHKSLRLRTAISANPVPVVRWDKAGVVLETGNKYSIYNDGDFYYLEVGCDLNSKFVFIKLYLPRILKLKRVEEKVINF